MIEASLLKLLSAGGDLAVIALLVVMWRFDRRLLRLETLICNGHRREKEKGA